MVKINKIISGILLWAVMTLCVCIIAVGLGKPNTAFAEVTELSGEGTKTTPYLIGSVEDLVFLSEMVNTSADEGKYNQAWYKVTADIDTSSTGFSTPIGLDYSNPFIGHFDGAGHTIVLDIRIEEDTENPIGLFGFIDEGGEVFNVITEGTVDYQGSYESNATVGGICGRNWGKIYNCINKASVTAVKSIGGICGSNEWGSISNCINLGNIGNAEGQFIGGICYFNCSNIINCANLGTVIGKNYFNAVCNEFADGDITSCYYNSDIGSDANATGLSSELCSASVDNQNSLLYKLNKYITDNPESAADWWIWSFDDKGNIILEEPIPVVKYDITNGSKIDDKEKNHGYITIDKTSEEENKTITITVVPNTGYKLESLKYSDGKTSIDIAKDTTTGEFQFVMPATAVTVTAVFEEILKVGNLFADENGINYVVTSVGETKTVKVGDNTDFEGTSVTIPATVSYNGFTFSVTEIGDSAYKDTGVTSVAIPDSVIIIGDSAFENCEKINNIVLPNNLIEIGESAFECCDGLTSITIPSKVAKIGKWAFDGCESLTTVICNTVNPPELGEDVFRDEKLSQIIVLSSSLETYKKDADWSTYADKIVGDKICITASGYYFDIDNTSLYLVAEGTTYLFKLKENLESGKSYDFTDMDLAAVLNDKKEILTSATDATVSYTDGKTISFVATMVLNDEDYEITFESYEIILKLGEAWLNSYETAGTTYSVDGETLIIGKSEIKSFPSFGYELDYWKIDDTKITEEGIITGPATFTAVFKEKIMAVTDILPNNFPAAQNDGWINEHSLRAYLDNEILNVGNVRLKSNLILDKDGSNYVYSHTSYKATFVMTDNKLTSIIISGVLSSTANGTFKAITSVAKPTADTTNFVYSGEEQTYQLTANDAYTISENTTQTAAGTYTITVSLINAQYKWADDTTDDLTFAFTIAQAKVAKPTADTTNFVYTGEAITYEIAENSLYEVTGNVQTTAGAYNVAVVLKDKTNYKWADDTTDDLTFAFTIAKAEVAKPAADTTNFVYTGEAITYEIAENSLYEVTGIVQTNAGNYNVVVALKDKTNYKWTDDTTDDLTFAFTIAKAEVAKPTADTTNFIYTGSELIYSVTENSLYTVTGNKQTEVGNYKVTITLKDNTNYKWVNGNSEDLTYDFVINQKVEDVVIKDEQGQAVEDSPVSIVVAENGIAPDAVFVVKVMNIEKAEDTEATENALNSAGKIGRDEKIFGIYDAKLVVNDVEIQPNGRITIKMAVPEELLGKAFKLYHIHNGDEIYEITYSDVDEEGFVTFETDKLSQFAFIGEDPNASAAVLSAGAIAGIIIGTIIAALIIAFILGKAMDKIKKPLSF